MNWKLYSSCDDSDISTVTDGAHVSVSTRMFLNAFIQYNSVTNQVLSNIRYNFIHRPLSDLFIVYNETTPTVDGRPPARALTVKFTQLFSF